MSLRDRFLGIINNGMRAGEELDPRVKTFISDIIDKWSFVVTPFVLDNPSDNFQKVVYFYQNGIAIEKSGRLVGAKTFSFTNPDVFRKFGTEESKKEIASNVNELKWNPFDKKLPLSPQKWEEFQNKDKTIESSFKLFDQMLWKSFKNFNDIENIGNVNGFEGFDYNDDKDIKAKFQIDKIKKYIFSDTVKGQKVEDLIETRGNKEYVPRGDMNRSIKKAFISEYKDYIAGKSFEAMKTFSEEFDENISLMTKKDDFSIFLYNKFMGFKGNEKNKDVGQFLKVINERFPWALNFTGELDAEMSESLIKEVNEMTKRGIDQEDIDEHIHDRLVETIEKNNQISRKAIELMEACFNEKELYGLSSLKKLTEQFSENKEAKSLFADIGDNMTNKLITAAIRQKTANDKNDIMNMPRIMIFNRIRQQKTILESLGMTCKLKLPETLEEIDYFLENEKLLKEFHSVLSKERVTLYAHELLQNVLSTPIKNPVPMTTKEVLNIVYKDGASVSDIVKTILRSEFVRTRQFVTDIDKNMKAISNIPLPVIPGLNKRYTIKHNEKFYHIEFPETLNEIKNMMTWNTIEDGFDGDYKENQVTGDLKRLYGVLGQRIISQSTSYMVADNNEVKKPFIIRSDSEVSNCIPYAYGEIDIMALTNKIPEKIFSMILIDGMNTDKDEISKVLSKMKTINIPTLDANKIKQARNNNCQEILKHKDNGPLIKPLHDDPKPSNGIPVLEWLRKRIVYPEIKNESGLKQKVIEMSNEIKRKDMQLENEHKISNDF